MTDRTDSGADNAVARAIRQLGGMTQAVVKTEISEATWHRWRRTGRIADPAAVFLVSDLTGISARELAGLRVVTGQGPTPEQPRKATRGAGRGPARRCFPASAERSTPAHVEAIDRLVGTERA